jgi:Lrp/AsnC family transcriptional regulator for asnA, asnC and gidA
MVRKRKRSNEIIDDLDNKIIRELQHDARKSFLSIGKTVGASEVTVKNRVNALLKRKLISLQAVINPLNFGYDFLCIIGLEIAIENLPEAELILSKNPNVYFLAGCTGVFDVFAILLLKNSREYNKFLSEVIAKLPGIKRSQTFVILHMVKNPWDENIISAVKI